MSDATTNDKSLADETYGILLEEILSAQLAGGAVIQERRLADRLHVSRSPMRDALGRLEGQGLLVRNKKGVLTVRVITLKDYLNSLAMRLLVEPSAAALASVHIVPATVHSLEEMLKAIENDPDPNQAFVWQFDDMLHQEIGEASGNQFMADTIVQMRRYTTIFERQRKLAQRKPGLEDHRAIILALGQRNADAAKAAMALHLERVRENVLASY
ncbi:FCD domain-containing protein [Agrobacterium vitis]|uniref:FCD domain-containing protein n=1 Tax=Agrobacterium vitis TaxID=373 RepID=A0A1S2E353_AGRVI|nr:GntR family transcriptional regulator [Agrobacterium vitis]MUO80899.1 FCD domain-containing protein [Agrobacterium vitis]MUO94807.1 FCD domain-containing protein [Agrobacterium vitis]MUP05431.1 FCD domain-containing protein [Agrobacterium vitis]MUZ81575.1 FCD domain-containing protein [Agrobacterium vitis]MVA56677.1 FCD domain-containing protein [Agrobacterium vitis]